MLGVKTMLCEACNKNILKKNYPRHLRSRVHNLHVEIKKKL